MSFDLATTGNRVIVDRIIAASVRSTAGVSLDLLVDPGPGISIAPYKRHGITIETARAGLPPAVAFEKLADTLAAHLATKNPLVVWCAPWTLSVLESELLRHGLRSLASRSPAGLGPIADPWVLDRHADPYRSGGRALETVTAWYGIPHDHPGHPASDAEAALILARVIPACYPAIGKLSRPALHREQTKWRAEHVAWIRERNPTADHDPRWPLVTVAAAPWTPPPPPETPSTSSGVSLRRMFGCT